MWIRGHGVIHRHNTLHILAALFGRNVAFWKLSVLVKELLERTAALKPSPRALGTHRLVEYACSCPLRATTGSFTPNASHFLNLIVCQNCRSQTVALMACFSPWQPLRARAATLLLSWYEVPCVSTRVFFYFFFVSLWHTSYCLTPPCGQNWWNNKDFWN